MNVVDRSEIDVPDFRSPKPDIDTIAGTIGGKTLSEIIGIEAFRAFGLSAW